MGGSEPESASEQEDLYATNQMLVTVVQVCIGLASLLNSFLIGYSLASLRSLVVYPHILLYVIFLGFNGILQSVWGLYLVIGEIHGYWAISQVTGCYLVVVCERYVESFPFLVFTCLCFDLSGLLSKLPKTGRSLRPLFLVFTVTCFVAAINIPVFASAKVVKTLDPDKNQTVDICVTGIPTYELVVAHRLALLFICYLGPFLLCLALHLFRLLRTDCGIGRLGWLTLAIFLCRWLSWLLVWAHITLMEVDSSLFGLEMAVRFWTVAAIATYVTLVVEGVLYVTFVHQIRKFEGLLRANTDTHRYSYSVPPIEEVKV